MYLGENCFSCPSCEFRQNLTVQFYYKQLHCAADEYSHTGSGAAECSLTSAASSGSASKSQHTDVYVWGSNSSHQLAEGNQEKILSPKLTSVFADCQQVSFCESHCQQVKFVFTLCKYQQVSLCSHYVNT